MFLYLHLWYFVSSVHLEGPGWLNELGRCRARVAQWVRSLDLTAHTSLSPIRRGFAPSFANYKKGCTRLAAANDNVYQLLAQGWWFFPGSPASSTTKTGRHDIAEILLKVAFINQKSNQICSFEISIQFAVHIYMFFSVLKQMILQKP